MGELDEGYISESNTPEERRNSKLIATIMLLLGLFAPLLMYVFSYEWMTPRIEIMSMFWIYSSEPYYMSSFSGFSLISPYVIFSMFPFILLRMVPVSQIYRYYIGKTTRKRAIIASIVGDGIFLVTSIPYLLLSSIMGLIMLPLPFQLIFGLLVLWRYPIPEPTTPWKSEEKPKSWWDKDSVPPQEKQEKPTKDDNDMLW